MASLTIKGVAKAFGKTPALNGIELAVPDREFCVLAGPSGAGKSTLLRAIAGLEGVDTGAIEIDSEVVNDWHPGARNLAMVFQSDALFPVLSVYNNIAFGLKARRVERAEIESRVKRAADLLGIADLLPLSTRELSLPARARVAIARAVVGEVGLCLLDEPLADINGDMREALRAEIKLLHRKYQMTTLYATNDAFEAMTIGERVVLMRAGKIEQEGAPLALFERPVTRFVAGYFGWPKMNFLHGALARSTSGEAIRIDGINDAVKLPPNRVPQDVADGSPIILGLRPEHMIRAIRVSPPDGIFRHEAEVEALQPVGARTYATFRMGATPVVAELQAHDVSRPGDRIRIDVNLKRASLFDAATEKVLQPNADSSIGSPPAGNVENRTGGE